MPPPQTNMIKPRLWRTIGVLQQDCLATPFLVIVGKGGCREREVSECKVPPHWSSYWPLSFFKVALGWKKVGDSCCTVWCYCTVWCTVWCYCTVWCCVAHVGGGMTEHVTHFGEQVWTHHALFLMQRHWFYAKGVWSFIQITLLTGFAQGA